MKPFCEVIVSDFLPAIRAAITKELFTTHGLTQKEISEKLGITQPAVSQYLKKIRGDVNIIKNKKIMKEIKKLSGQIAKEKLSWTQIHRTFCAICLELREARVVCKLHEKNFPTPGSCKICYEMKK